jgi:alpha-glucosidase
VISDDRPWYVQEQRSFSPGPDTDILRPRPELRLPEILDYAGERGVSIRLWVHANALAPKLEEAFALYSAWGVKGLMVDFVNRDDQETVRFCEEVLKVAARNHLHIQFHGIYKPTGLRRTYPNLVNHEGVLNLEYLKWSARCTPGHNVTVPYTRMLAGPMDYHSGGFRGSTTATFEARDNAPYVLGTRCHHLAMYVVYENPMPMVCDFPTSYEGQPGFEFVTEVPTTWDETRFLAGQPAEYIVLARRQGDVWYVGGMTDAPREVRLPLDFLDDGSYELASWSDDVASRDPNALVQSVTTVGPGDEATFSLAGGGGFVLRLSPPTESGE